MLAKKIFLAIILSFLVLAISWYYHNQTAKNIVSGVVSDPISNLMSDSGRTNIALLGIGGQGHEGGDLTDSILFVSFKLSDGTADMIAIPRDVWIPSMKAKINTAYHYGNERREGGGTDLVKSAISETLGVPIHYAVTLDFQGFIKAIDAVGGVDVEVKNSFDDYKYPIPGKETVEPESDRYEHVHFDAGLTHMDGTTALKFARSRHAEGDEGTDFARGSRQQKIILAFRNKVFSTGTILSSETITKLKDSISSSVDTDISSKEYGSFLKVFLGLGNKENLKSVPLTDYLINPKNTRAYGGQWVLVPTTTWEDVHAYVAKELISN
jgi:LCP family protein required for cell wall assembly